MGRPAVAASRRPTWASSRGPGRPAAGHFRKSCSARVAPSVRPVSGMIDHRKSMLARGSRCVTVNWLIGARNGLAEGTTLTPLVIG